MIRESLDYAKAARYCMPMYVKMLFFFFYLFRGCRQPFEINRKGNELTLHHLCNLDKVSNKKIFQIL